MAVKNVVHEGDGSKCLLDGLGCRDLRAKVVKDNLGQLGAGDLVRPIGDFVKGSLRNKSLGGVTSHSDFNLEQGRSSDSGVSGVLSVDAALHLPMKSRGDLWRDVGL